MGAEYSHVQKNSGDIPPGKLRRGGTCDTIKMDISTTRHEEYGRRVHGSGEDAPGNCFASPFFWRVKISLTHRRNSKYDAGLEILPGPPESFDVREQKYKFAMCKHRVDSRRDG